MQQGRKGKGQTTVQTRQVPRTRLSSRRNAPSSGAFKGIPDWDDVDVESGLAAYALERTLVYAFRPVFSASSVIS